jgi:hypothetical protein
MLHTHRIFTNSFFTTFLLPNEFFFGFLCVNQPPGEPDKIEEEEEEKKGGGKKRKKLSNF